MTSPWPLFDEMLVSLPLDNLLCCSSSLPFGVTQLSIYRLDIIPIYFALWLFLRFFNWEKSFWKFRFLKYSRNLIFENFDFLLKFFFRSGFLLILNAVKKNNYAWYFWNLCKPYRKLILNLPIDYYNNYCKKLSVRTYESYGIWSIL